jgi:hypothetical protein
MRWSLLLWRNLKQKEDNYFSDLNSVSVDCNSDLNELSQTIQTYVTMLYLNPFILTPLRHWHTSRPDFFFVIIPNFTIFFFFVILSTLPAEKVHHLFKLHSFNRHNNSNFQQTHITSVFNLQTKVTNWKWVCLGLA